MGLQTKVYSAIIIGTLLGIYGQHAHAGALKDNSQNQIPAAYLSCDGSACPVDVYESGIHITEPKSSSSPSTCRFNFHPPAGFCQVRLDFINFRMAGPNSNGDCDMDSFRIAGADNLEDFVTCGMNTGQHMYLHYGLSDTISASIVTAAGSTYDISVNYIPCDACTSSCSSGNDTASGNCSSVVAAPPGCTQYYTSASSGQVKSFNYHLTTDFVYNQYQINNEMYTICVETLPGSSQITWTKCSNQDSFFVSSPGDVGPLTGDRCITDFVDIPGGSGGGRYCGSEFPPAVTSTAKPYIMYVNFDDAEALGLNAPIDPSTGCPITADCVYYGDPIIPPNIPDGAVYPCPSDPNLLPDFQWCQLKPFFAENSDFANSGFCLKWNVIF